MIDEDFRVWLIEINENPHLGMPNDLMKKLVPKMLDDLLKSNFKIFFNQKINEDNDFELIYSDNID